MLKYCISFQIGYSPSDRVIRAGLFHVGYSSSILVYQKILMIIERHPQPLKVLPVQILFSFSLFNHSNAIFYRADQLA
jgi:hypothetical protein